jgi:hypothetical protein
MKDFVPPQSVDITNCGKVIIHKETIPDETDQPFTYTSTLNREGTTGDNPGFSLNDNDQPPPATPVPDTITFTDVLPGTGYSVTESALPTGWQFVNVACGGQTSGVFPTFNQVTRTVSFDIDSASDVLECTFTNRLAVANLSTEQTYIPQDKATITGTGLNNDGRFDFKLRSGTLGPAPETCANTTDTVVYQEDDVAISDIDPDPAVTTHGAVTSNDGVPADASAFDTDTDAGFSVNTLNAGSYYWQVTYENDSSGAVPVTSCVEDSSVTISNI